MTSFNLRIK